MIHEEIIDEESLLNNLQQIIEKIHEKQIVFLVYRSDFEQESDFHFILGPREVCGLILGLIDEEYGWPFSVSIDQVKSISDIAPGYRKHPFISDNNNHLAVSIQKSEYEIIKKKLQ